MAEKLNAVCSICGEKYHLCASCKNMMELNPWKIHTDTSEHYKIYQIIHGYSVNVFTKEEAKTRLKNVDLSDLESLRDNIKKIIKDIMKEDKNEEVKITSFIESEQSVSKIKSKKMK